MHPARCKNRSLNVQCSFIVGFCLFCFVFYSILLSLHPVLLAELLTLVGYLSLSVFQCTQVCFHDAPIITVGELYSSVERRAFYADKDGISNCYKTVSVLVSLPLHECDYTSLRKWLKQHMLNRCEEKWVTLPASLLIRRIVLHNDWK